MLMIEGECADLYAAAGASVVYGTPLGQIMCNTMGAPPRFAPEMARDVVTLRKRKAWRVFVRWGLEIPRARYLASGELARWWLRRYGALAPTPTVVSRLAAAILTPAPMFRFVVQSHGTSVEMLADAFGIPEPLVLLRLGEVCGMPVALVSKDRKLIMLRGDSHRRCRAKTIHFHDDDRLGRVYG